MEEFVLMSEVILVIHKMIAFPWYIQGQDHSMRLKCQKENSCVLPTWILITTNVTSWELVYMAIFIFTKHKILAAVSNTLCNCSIIEAGTPYNMLVQQLSLLLIYNTIQYNTKYFILRRPLSRYARIIDWWLWDSYISIHQDTYFLYDIMWDKYIKSVSTIND